MAGQGGGIAVNFKEFTDKLLSFDGTLNTKTDSLERTLKNDLPDDQSEQTRRYAGGAYVPAVFGFGYQSGIAQCAELVRFADGDHLEQGQELREAVCPASIALLDLSKYKDSHVFFSRV